MAGVQHRFAFVRNEAVAASEAFKQALAAAGVDADTPATVLCDGDAGLWRLQRAALPQATVVLDWWRLAVRFEHALQAARGFGAGTAEKHLADQAVHELERAKWRLWHGRWPGCRRKLAALCRWMQRKPLVRSPASAGSSATSASYAATSRATRTCWCTMLPGVDGVSRSRARSWRVRSTRS